MKKFYIGLLGLLVAVSSIALFNFLGGVSNAAQYRDCTAAAIINCGALTPKELADKYIPNKPGDYDNVYRAYGYSTHDMTNAGTVAKMGEVKKDGRVIVNGKVVATDAKMLGRYGVNGSTKRVIDGKTYYEHPTSISFFEHESISAYIFFDANGDFRGAILTACGNPVTAKKPVYKCDSLTKKAITRTKYSFTGAASASNGASIANYTYDFGDGQKTTTTAKTVEHEYAKPGTYTVKLSVNMNVAGTSKTVTGPNCEVKVTVENPPVTPTYVCDYLKASKISRLETSFTGKATVTGGAVIESYVFDFGDSKTETVTNPNNVKHTYAQAKEYTAKLTVNVKVNNQTKAVTGPNCIVKVTISPEECKPGVPVGHKDCEEKPEECKPGIPVGHKDCEEPKECKPGIPEGDDRCKEECKPGIPVGDERCEEIPAELPKTGPMDMLLGTFGLGSLAAGGYYWHASRRGLLSALLNR